MLKEQHHGCTRDTNVIALASMDTLDHGCTTDTNVIILASMDAFDYGHNFSEVLHSELKKDSFPVLPRIELL